MTVLDIAAIITVSVVTGAVSDLVVKRLVNDREEYKELSRRVERQKREVDLLRSQPSGSEKHQRRHERELASAEARLQEDTTKLTGLTMRGGLFNALFAFGVFWLLGSFFEKTVVARLPFEPVWWFKGMAHRGLDGDDKLGVHCGYLFIYILAQMCVRPMVSKVLGTEQPKTASPFDAFTGGSAGGRAFGL